MLNDAQIRNAKPGPKAYKLLDGAGLYLEVSPSGGKLWRYRYRFLGKESVVSLGDYPRVGLSEARRLREDSRALIKSGINPAQQKRQDKLRLQYDSANTFETVAKEWFDDQSGPWSKGYRGHVNTILTKDILPRIGNLPIKDIETPILHQVLKKIEARQAPTRAILARQIMGKVFGLAMITGRAKGNPVEPLKRTIARCVVEHRKHLERNQIGDFLRQLEDYSGHPTTIIGLKLLFLTVVRPGELCGAPWREFNFEAKEWRIPASRMKMREPHIVPLSRQALEQLKALESLTGHTEWLFPTQGTKSQTTPTATLRNAVFKMGWSDRFSPHGARGTFSTILNEEGYSSDAIERQLAHSERNKVRASYHHTQYLAERGKLMQDWADLLDRFQFGAKVLEFKSA